MDPVSCLEVLTTSLFALLLVTSEFQGLGKRYSFQSSAPHPETDHPNCRLDLERFTVGLAGPPDASMSLRNRNKGEPGGHFQRREGNVFFIKSLMVGLI